MNPLVFALIYGFFAILFVISNLQSLQISRISSVYESGVLKLSEAPFSLTPLRYLNDIKTSEDIYRWTQEVGVQALFSETPQNSDPVGFCTDTKKCGIAEGSCAGVDSVCGAPTDLIACGDRSAGLTRIKINGRIWERADLEEWCQYQDTPIDTSKMCLRGLENPSCKQAAPYCLDPYTPDPSNPIAVGKAIEYLHGIYLESSETGFGLGYGAVQVTTTCPAYMSSSVSCCTPNFAPLDLIRNLNTMKFDEAIISGNKASSTGQSVVTANELGIRGSLGVDPSTELLAQMEIQLNPDPIVATKRPSNYNKNWNTNVYGVWVADTGGVGGSGGNAGGPPGKTGFLEPIDSSAELYSSTTIQEQRNTMSGSHQITLAGFNQILMLRFTLKRYSFRKNPAKLFRKMFPFVFSSDSFLDPNLDNGDMEYKGSFKGAKTGKTYSYSQNGYNNVGGYVVILNPKQITEKSVKELLEELYYDGWFNLEMGSFVFDMIIFNGNSRHFVQLGFAWSFTFSGAASRESILNAMSLDLYNFEVGGTLFRCLLEFLVIVLMISFVGFEIEKAKFIGPSVYVRQKSAWIENISLLLCWIVVLLRFVIIFDTTYTDYEFNDNVDYTDQQLMEQFNKLETLAGTQKSIATAVGVTLSVVFVKAVVLVADLSPWLGLISKVIGRAGPNLVFFTTMFFIIFSGFVLFGFFLFGRDIELLSSFGNAIIYLFALLCGGGAVTLGDFVASDAFFGPLFCFLFYLVLIFIMLNVFLSILLASYDIERFELEMNIKSGNQINVVQDGLKQMNKLIVDYLIAPAGTICRCFYTTIFGKPQQQEMLDDNKDSEFFLRGKEGSNMQRQKTATQIVKAKMAIPLIAMKNKAQFFLANKKEVFAAHLGHTKLFANFAGKEKTEDEKEREEMLRRRHENQKMCVAFIMLLLYVALFTTLMAIQVRGAESFNLVQSNLQKTTQEQEWIDSPPLRIMAYDRIKSMDDVYRWSKVAVLGLYQTTFCMPKPGDDPLTISTFLDLVGQTGVGRNDESALLLDPNEEGLCDDLEAFFRQRRLEGKVNSTTVADYLAHRKLRAEMVGATEIRRTSMPKLKKTNTNMNTTMPVTSAKGRNLQGGTDTTTTTVPPHFAQMSRIMKWNAGFMLNTLVRLSIQQACYEVNPDTKWKSRYQYLRKNGLSGHCTDTGCEDSNSFAGSTGDGNPGDPIVAYLSGPQIGGGIAPNSAGSSTSGGGSGGAGATASSSTTPEPDPAGTTASKTCLTNDGRLIDFDSDYIGPISQEPYKRYALEKLGPYGSYGGFSIHLGKNLIAASKILDRLFADDFFNANSVVSMVFDWVAYNGNLDLYVYNSIKFSQSETGKLFKEAKSQPLPLSLMADGNYYSGHRIAAGVLAIFYMVCAVIYVYKEFQGILAQYRDTNMDWWIYNGDVKAPQGYHKNGRRCAEGESRTSSKSGEHKDKKACALAPPDKISDNRTPRSPRGAIVQGIPVSKSGGNVVEPTDVEGLRKRDSIESLVSNAPNKVIDSMNNPGPFNAMKTPRSIRSSSKGSSRFAYEGYVPDQPHFFQFVADYYSKSYFRILETTSSVLSMVVIVTFFLYINNAFRQDYRITADPTKRYSVPNSEVKHYGMVEESHPDRAMQEDNYIFLKFLELEGLFTRIITIAGFNSLFLTFKILQYILDWELFHTVATTFRQAFSLIVIFTLILGLQLIGFALLYHVEFGILVSEFGTSMKSITTMFKFLLGDFERVLIKMQKKGEVFTFITFVLFMLFFQFILINMYLATVMSTYNNTKSARMIKSAKRIARQMLENKRKAERIAAQQKARLSPMSGIGSGVSAAAETTRLSPISKSSQDPSQAQTGLLIQETVRCLQNLARMCGSSSQEFFEEHVEKPTPAFWIQLSALSELGRDLNNACSKFEYRSDIQNCLPENCKFLSLTPEEESNWKNICAKLEQNRKGPSTVVKRDAGSDNGPTKNTDSVVGASPKKKGEEDPKLNDLDKQEFYTTSLHNSILGMMFSAKGSRIFQTPHGNNTTFGNENFASQTHTINDFKDAHEIGNFLASNVVYGEEMWLDALVVAIEKENPQFINQLLTKDAVRPKTEKISERVLDKLRAPLYGGGEKILTLLEYKARTAYYLRLKEEGILKQQLYSQQNQLLHDYVLELQGQIRSEYREIAELKAKKRQLLGIVQGCL